MISFIIPAYNEEALLGKALDSVFSAARAVGEPYEVIVVDDASSDRTADIARERGARVVAVHKRQIAAVRNAGTREAKGDIFIFLDADTVLPEAVLRDALAALSAGAIGGGARVQFDRPPSLAMRLAAGAFTFWYFQVARWAAGCFIFVRREVFEKIGGFDERYFASEECHLSMALKKQGRFVVLKSSVVTSDRKFRFFTPWQMAKMLLRMGCRRKGLQKREGLELWYDGKREGQEEKVK